MAQISAMKQFRHCIQLLVLILALGSVLPAQAEIVERNGRIFVNNDRGGNVMDMVQTRSRLENSGKPVWIRGYCRSACTMLITMRNACLYPRAEVAFTHRASPTPRSSRPMSPRSWRRSIATAS